MSSRLIIGYYHHSCSIFTICCSAHTKISLYKYRTRLSDQSQHSSIKLREKFPSSSKKLFPKDCYRLWLEHGTHVHCATNTFHQTRELHILCFSQLSLTFTLWPSVFTVRLLTGTLEIHRKEFYRDESSQMLQHCYGCNQMFGTAAAMSNRRGNEAALYCNH